MNKKKEHTCTVCRKPYAANILRSALRCPTCQKWHYIREHQKETQPHTFVILPIKTGSYKVALIGDNNQEDADFLPYPFDLLEVVVIVSEYITKIYYNDPALANHYIAALNNWAKQPGKWTRITGKE